MTAVLPALPGTARCSCFQGSHGLMRLLLERADMRALSWASPAWAPGCPSCNTTSLFLPLSGLFFYPAGPGRPGENVSLTGDVHVVSKVEAVVGGKFLTDIHLNMAGLTGTGQDTGAMYIGTGSTKFLNVAYPPSPVIPADPLLATFSIERTGRGASVPLSLKFAL